jgi:DNA polymerase-3 subunit gamma/tau
MMTLNVLYRPMALDELMGNEAAVESLRSVLGREKDVPGSYFFTGLPGGGKTTLAYVIKEELSISDMDFYEYNSANTRGIDTIRDIASYMKTAPMNGDRKLYLLDECHQITGAALEALLKILEVPPKHVIFVLCTSEPEKIRPITLKAIRRRCFEAEVKPLRSGQIVNLIEDVLHGEDVKDFPKEITKKIAKNCWGSAGQALSLLDAVIDMGDIDQMLESIENLVLNEASVLELSRLLTDNRITGANKWEQIRVLLPKVTGDPESIRYAISTYFDKTLLGKPLSPGLMSAASCFTDSFMYTGRLGLTLACALACSSDMDDDIPF